MCGGIIGELRVLSSTLVEDGWCHLQGTGEGLSARSGTQVWTEQHKSCADSIYQITWILQSSAPTLEETCPLCVHNSLSLFVLL